MAFLAFFVAEGPIHGIQKSSDRIEDTELRQIVVFLSIGAQALAVLAGVVFLVLGCRNMP